MKAASIILTDLQLPFNSQDIIGGNMHANEKNQADYRVQDFLL